MKSLFTAEKIKELHKSGQTSVEVSPKSTIITPEARDVAKKLGVKIIDVAVSSEPHQDGASRTGGQPDSLQAIKKAVRAKLPASHQNSGLLDQLIEKALKELQHQDVAGPSCEREKAPNGVVLVRGNSVKPGKFDGAGGKPIGLTDVIGPDDKSSIAAGYMQWDNCSFPWTLNYDEIDVVLEGELHITCGDKTHIGKPGDVFFIPKGASIEFGSPGKVRFVYVTYPADWSAQ
ncbi:ethanolamine utilization acetate kinase EutQ [Marinobacter sp. 1_MG-2023]|uniref:ethanolamine utilization acetate kinase EutQ n=1 Tax=Marinobacter sp. 1_MG-2023 TaxID=3062627 RepID=UPI0026E16EDE|nr:ethanolamine utilization acetate kinase EutQ [Marinobacter sp. 1_MG-2023]MDO6824649.1 ethanolamine utilization acetate kinase EutQ [Marinobacter sp. 1_MG-2023]